MDASALRRCSAALRLAAVSWLLLAGLPGPVQAQLRTASDAERALDQAAFQPVQQALAARLTDIQSVVVVLRGRVVLEFYRDGLADRLRPTQSVRKSALSTLVGIALQQGKLASLEQPVLALVPEWAALNADPRTAAITVRHLLTLTAGFDFDDPDGIRGGGTRPADAWARPLRWTPGERFGYDNALVPLLMAVLERAVGMPLAEFSRQQLEVPLAIAPPAYVPGLQARTLDLAKLGQLLLNDGVWDGRQLLPAAYARAATAPQSAGGTPASLPYGYMWWVLPSREPHRTFLASGYAGQMIWAHQALGLVVAATSTVSADSQRRGHTLALLRSGLVAAAQQRAGDQPP